MDSGRRKRRPRSRFDDLRSAADRGVTWAVDASHEIRGWIAPLLFLAAVGAFIAPLTLYDRWQAQSLVGDGEWVSAERVQVHVRFVSGRGGGYSEVDRVRVELEQWVDLENVNALARSTYDDVPTG